ncbi:MAG: flippase-like domain-containing protein [Candidatus Aminicenantes bacterium]|nr:flippase-like domain-containing protein [Candidatus Aminicenantes bacterium]
MSKKTAFFLFRLVFGLGLLLYVVLGLSRPREIVAALQGASWPLLGLAFALHVFGFLFSARRWKLILDERGAGFTTPQLIRSLLVGSFFNLFLPTRFGGDVVRVSDTRRIVHGMTGSLAVVVYERMSGIVALLLMALFSSLVKIQFLRQMPLLYASLALSLLGVFLLLLAWKKVPRGFFAARRCRRPWLRKILGKMDAFHGIILDFLLQRRLSRRVFSWALLLQLNVVLHYFLIGRALGLGRIPVLDYFFSIPLMLFVLSFPVSINGIGVRDLFLIKLFTYYRYPAQFAIAFSLLDLAFNVIVGIVGGLIYIFRRK